MKVVVAGGGTAGHVNPAISFARSLVGDEVVFVGTTAGAEASLVPSAGFPLETISIQGFDRARPVSLITVGPRAVGAIFAARKVLKRHRPDAVVGMGGYVSLPVCLAAASARVPTILHEQNIVLGLAHRVCKPFAKRVAVSFEETLEQAGSKGIWTGNPISREMSDGVSKKERAAGMARFELNPKRKTLLVFGGSLGAQRINEAAAGLPELWRDRAGVQILHILGRARASEEPQGSVGGGKLTYRRVGYVDRMIEAYAVADLVLCRGGATTLAELASTGLPSIIVPYPHHRDQQQEKQARVFERAGASRVLLDDDCRAETVAQLADMILRDSARLAMMSRAAYSLGKPDAAKALADVVRGAAAQ